MSDVVYEMHNIAEMQLSEKLNPLSDVDNKINRCLLYKTQQNVSSKDKTGMAI